MLWENIHTWPSTYVPWLPAFFIKYPCHSHSSWYCFHPHICHDNTSIHPVFLLSLLNVSKISGHQGTGLGLKVGKTHLSIWWGSRVHWQNSISLCWRHFCLPCAAPPHRNPVLLPCQYLFNTCFAPTLLVEPCCPAMSTLPISRYHIPQVGCNSCLRGHLFGGPRTWNHNF